MQHQKRKTSILKITQTKRDLLQKSKTKTRRDIKRWLRKLKFLNSHKTKTAQWFLVSIRILKIPAKSIQSLHLHTNHSPTRLHPRNQRIRSFLSRFIPQAKAAPPSKKPSSRKIQFPSPNSQHTLLLSARFHQPNFQSNPSLRHNRNAPAFRVNNHAKNKNSRAQFAAGRLSKHHAN